MGLRVPQYQRQVGQAALRGGELQVNAPIEAFGGGQGQENIAKATDRLVGTVTSGIDKYVQQADEIAFMGADSQAQALMNTKIYSTDPKNPGLLMAKGKNAVEQSGKYTEDFNKGLTEIENTLSNDRQKAMFRKSAASYRFKFQSDTEKYVAAESETFMNETSKARITIAKQDALLNYSDPISRQISAEKIEGTLKFIADAQGKSPEWLEAERSKEFGEMHSGVVDRFLDNGQYTQAKEYFETNKAAFGNNLPQAEKNLMAGSIKGESQKIVDDLMNKNPSMTGGLAELRKIEAPNVRDAATERFKIRQAEKETATRADDEARYKRAYDLVSGKGGNFENLTPSQLAGMSSAQRKELAEVSQRTAEKIPFVTDTTFKYDMERMAANPATQGEFLRMNLLESRSKLSKEDFEKFSSLQASLNKGDTRLAKGIMSNQQIVDSALNNMNIDPTERSGNVRKKADVFRKAVDDAKFDYEERTGKLMSPQELTQLTDRLTREYISKERWLFSDKKVKGYEIPNLKIKDVPNDDIEKITEALAAKGQKPTDELILKAFKTKVSRTPSGE